MQIVIEVPDEEYDNALHDDFAINVYRDAVKAGTVLPKGHGRLIDADTFERRCMFDSDIEDMQDVIYALRDYGAVLEADKED